MSIERQPAEHPTAPIMSVSNSTTDFQFQFQYHFADLPAESEIDTPPGDAALDGLGAVRFAYIDSGSPNRSAINGTLFILFMLRVKN